MKDKEKFSIDGFERMFQFTYYFPSGNYDLVIKKYKICLLIRVA